MQNSFIRHRLLTSSFLTLCILCITFSIRGATIRPGVLAVDVFEQSIFLGAGFDTQEGRAKPSSPCNFVTNSPSTGKYEFYMRRVDRSRSVRRSQSAHASASGWGVDGSVDFEDTMSFDSSSTYVLVRIRYDLAMESLTNPKLSFDAETELKNGSFRAAYGDAYITGMRYGGEMFGLFRVRSSTKDEKRTFDSSIKASWSAFGGEAELHKLFSTHDKKKTLEIKVKKVGGDATTPMTLPEFLKAIRKFPDEVLGNAKNNRRAIVMKVELTPVTTILGLSAVKPSTPLTTSYTAAKLRTELVEVSERHEDLAEAAKVFMNPDRKHLFPVLAEQEAVGEIQKNLKEMKIQLREAKKQLEESPFKPEYPEIEHLIEASEEKLAQMERQKVTMHDFYTATLKKRGAQGTGDLADPRFRTNRIQALWSATFTPSDPLNTNDFSTLALATTLDIRKVPKGANFTLMDTKTLNLKVNGSGKVVRIPAGADGISQSFLTQTVTTNYASSPATAKLFAADKGWKEITLTLDGQGADKKNVSFEAQLEFTYAIELPLANLPVGELTN